MNEIFSKNIRNLRLAKNLTQEQVAERLQVSAQSVSRWENMKRHAASGRTLLPY